VATAAAAGIDRRRRAQDVGRRLLARYGLLIAFVLVAVAFSLARPDSFPTIDNLKSILTAAAPALVVAAGLTVVLVMQDFDLSFGSMIGLGGATAVVLMAQEDVYWPLAVLVAVAIGLGAGVVNGVLVAYAGGSSFIITLAMSTVLIGVEFALTDQKTIFTGVPAGYSDISRNAFLFDLNNQIWIAAAFALLLWLLLEKTEMGRYMYAIGGNPEAARLSGVRIRELRLTGFVIVALSATLTGLLLTAESASSSPTIGTPYLLPAFAAVFLGAAVFRPGEFNLAGTVVGVLFLGMVQTGLLMLDLETFVINLIQGAILISAVLLSQLGQRVS
jgi:ribose transport system permease protein